MSVNNGSLVTDLIALLNQNQGTAQFEQIGREIFYLTRSQLPLVQQLLAGLLAEDPRFEFEADRLILRPDPAEAQPLTEVTFVVVDVETTGARAQGDRVTEIAAYKIKGGQIIGEFSTLVNPQCLISPYVVQLTGITNEMVARAPRFAEICADWLAFFGDAVFVAHNAPFDWRFVNHEVGLACGRSLTNSRVCTVQMARRLVPGLDNYQLHTVAEHYAIKITERHRAAGDALATTQIFLNFLALLADHQVPNLADARRFRLVRRAAQR